MPDEVLYENKGVHYAAKAERNLDHACEPPEQLSAGQKTQYANDYQDWASTSALVSMAYSLDRIADALEQLVRKGS